MNFTKPADIGIPEDYAHGLRSFHVNVIAWRWKLPSDIQGIISKKILEFIASVINIWMIFLESEKYTKIINLTESSITLGWLYK